MAEFASKGVAGAGLGLGIAGTALALLQNGGLGGLFGNNNLPVCSENTPVTRYELAQSEKIAALETEVKLRDANAYTIAQINGLRNYADGRFGAIEKSICEQAVYNATQTGVISCINDQVKALQGLTKLVVPNTSVCPGWGDVTIEPAK